MMMQKQLYELVKPVSHFNL